MHEGASDPRQLAFAEPLQQRQSGQAAPAQRSATTPEQRGRRLERQLRSRAAKDRQLRLLVG